MYVKKDVWILAFIKKDNNDICVRVLKHNKVGFFLMLHCYLLFIKIIIYQLNIIICAFHILIVNLIPYFSQLFFNLLRKNENLKKKKKKIEPSLTKWWIVKTFSFILYISGKKIILNIITLNLGVDFTPFFLFSVFILFYFFHLFLLLLLFRNISTLIGLYD